MICEFYVSRYNLEHKIQNFYGLEQSGKLKVGEVLLHAELARKTCSRLANFTQRVTTYQK